MPVIEVITREVCRKLNEEIRSALAMIGNRFGLTIDIKGATFSSTSVVFKVELAVQNADGNAMTPEADSYNLYAGLQGMKKEWLFQEFLFQGDKYQLVGMKPRSAKFPFLAKKVGTNKVYKMSEAAVKRGFEGK